ncbi:N-methylhydantoinase A [Paraburkholderia piptadeniae]|uniref:N-methylhydantoinase A n=1 Tax=Paraburkholderia piptadeniae TaxID=1701573 RepID=A0A1N7SPJ7_9BURK|nr:hydantoinase/oxoprolinase family protein [Paraburkholderia piptadeniae]SIT49371.1 N-methylhydantoinase A [Paraburkholderia piptadeniae]
MTNLAVGGSTTQSLRIGVDSGGTFTDVTMYNEATGEISIWKVSSTPDDPSRGIIDGVKQILERFANSADAQVVYFGHGTTVATNAVIQKRGAVTGLITTEGFRDVIEIGRQIRPSLYNLNVSRPEVLATRDNRHEVKERITWEGLVQTELDEGSVRAAARRLKDAGVSSIAVCLINSYRNPDHESAVKRILMEEVSEAFVSISSEIAPEYREFERTSTVLVNSYVGPIIRDYLTRLAPKLRETSVKVRPHLTQSNGGVISFDQAQREPVRTILSGPAAGVVGASAVAHQAGFDRIITFDMGGTSTDVALIEGAKPRFATETSVHGHPIRVPMLDIETVGAGGGSLASVDSGGLLEVGPASAGAFPGPACYEKGNTSPTVTDANVLLQVLNPEYLLAGRMKISQAAARTAIERLAASLNVDVMTGAQGIISMAVANMVKAVRMVSVERGYDPRDFTLVAFGGAGPVHATRLARELGIGTVLVPKTPGVLCSLGLLLSDLKTSFSVTRLCTLSEQSAASIDAAFEALDAKARAWFEGEEVESGRRVTKYSVDMRYAGQGHDLNVACLRLTSASQFVSDLRSGFEQLHQQMYGYTAPEEEIQITTFRVEVIAEVEKAPLLSCPDAATPVEQAVVSRRDIYMEEAGGWTQCPIYDRTALAPGHAVSGPAVIEQMDSTTLILPGQTATVDNFLNLIIKG